LCVQFRKCSFVSINKAKHNVLRDKSRKFSEAIKYIITEKILGLAFHFLMFLAHKKFLFKF